MDVVYITSLVEQAGCDAIAAERCIQLPGLRTHHEKVNLNSTYAGQKPSRMLFSELPGYLIQAYIVQREGKGC